MGNWDAVIADLGARGVGRAAVLGRQSEGLYGSLDF